MWRRAVSSWLASAPLLPATEIPSPRGLPIIGTTLDLIAAGGASRLHEYVDARHRQLGPIYRESIGPVNGVFVADPNEMRRVFTLEGKYPKHILPDAWVLYNKIYGSKRGLFFMDGEEWLHFRRIMNRHWLMPGSGYEVIGPCDFVATELVDRWTRKYNGREVIGLESELYRWAIKITVAVLMGDKYSKNQQQIEDMVEHFSSFIHLIFQESARLSLIPATVAAFLKIPAWRNFVSAVDEALAVANSLISVLMPECQNGEGLLGALLAEEIEHNDVVRIVVDLCLAAGDTIASSIQWMMYLLARNPDLQDELYAELLEVHKPEDTVQLPLVRGMMREALRLYPVAPFLSRYLPEDSMIGGYRVPSGDLILLSIYTSGHDARNFPEPDRFWPQRWTRDADGNYKGVSNPFASLPFAMGARSCIGRRIAETQLTLTVAKVIQKFKLELIEKTPVDMVLRLVAVPSRPVRLWLTER